MVDFLKKIGTTEVRVVIAILLTVGVLGLAYLILTKQVPEGNKDVAYTTMGALMSAYMLALGYFFGASKAHTDQLKKDK